MYSPADVALIRRALMSEETGAATAVAAATGSSSGGHASSTSVSIVDPKSPFVGGSPGPASPSKTLPKGRRASDSNKMCAHMRLKVRQKPTFFNTQKSQKPTFKNS